MIRLDAATVLLQWATGGLLFLWVTSRRRAVGIGYGWLLRGVYGAMAAAAVAAGLALRPVAIRDVCSGLVAAAAFFALVVSVVRRKAGVAGERAQPRFQTGQLVVREPGTDPAGVAQSAHVVVVAEQQRAEVAGAPALTWHPPGDDELLAAPVLDLEPRPRPLARFIGAVNLLRDEPFQALRPGRLE